MIDSIASNGPDTGEITIYENPPLRAIANEWRMDGGADSHRDPWRTVTVILGEQSL